MPLHPTARDDLYLKKVREFISTQVLGSSGGYPVYIKRWTRSGQARGDENLRSLLLGEPEAVVSMAPSIGRRGRSCWPPCRNGAHWSSPSPPWPSPTRTCWTPSSPIPTPWGPLMRRKLAQIRVLRE